MSAILRSSDSATAPEMHLNDVYIIALQHLIHPLFTDEEKEELYSMLRQILGSIVVLFSPLSSQSLSRLF